MYTVEEIARWKYFQKPHLFTVFYYLNNEKYGRDVEKQGNIPGDSHLGKGFSVQGPETEQKRMLCSSLIFEKRIYVGFDSEEF